MPACVPILEQGPYRDRKGNLTKNVLVAVNFDMLYAYTLYGWEGSAPDQRVMDSAVDHGGFNPIFGKYWLADAAYTNTSNVLTPFRGVRYHLKEWQRGGRTPLNSRELYNLRHAQKRNVEEGISTWTRVQ